MYKGRSDTFCRQVQTSVERSRQRRGRLLLGGGNAEWFIEEMAFARDGWHVSRRWKADVLAGKWGGKVSKRRAISSVVSGLLGLGPASPGLW